MYLTIINLKTNLEIFKRHYMQLNVLIPAPGDDISIPLNGDKVNTRYKVYKRLVIFNGVNSSQDVILLVTED